MTVVVAVVVMAVGAVSSPSCLGDGVTAVVWDKKRLITSCTRVRMSYLLRA